MKLPRHLRAVFGLAAAVALTGCATSPQQGCANIDTARKTAGADQNGTFKTPAHKAAANAAFLIPVIGPLFVAGAYGQNSREYDKLTPTK